MPATTSAGPFALLASLAALSLPPDCLQSRNPISVPQRLSDQSLLHATCHTLATCHLPLATLVWQVWLKCSFSEAPVWHCVAITLRLRCRLRRYSSATCNVQRVNCSCLSYVRTQQIAVAPHPTSPLSTSSSAHVIKCQCSWCAIPRDYPSHKCLRGRHSRVRCAPAPYALPCRTNLLVT